MKRRGLNTWAVTDRLKNMVTTTAEKLLGVSVVDAHNASKTDTRSVSLTSPNVLMNAGLDEVSAMDSSMYAAAHEGAHVKFSTIETLQEYAKMVHEENWDPHIAESLIQIVEDYRVDSLMMKERPGYADLREDTIRPFIRMFGSRPSRNNDANHTKALSAMTYGIDLREYPEWAGLGLDWDKIEKTAKIIMERVERKIEQGDTTSEDSAEIAEDLFRNIWYKESDGSGETPQSGGEEDDEEGEESSESTTSESTTSSSQGQGQHEEGNGEGSGTGENGEEGGEGENGDGGDGDGDGGDGEGDDGEGEGQDGQDKSQESAPKGGKHVQRGGVGAAPPSLDFSKSPFEQFLDDDGKKDFQRAQQQAKQEDENFRRTGASREERIQAMKDAMGIDSSLWSPEERARYERDVCTGVHAGQALHYWKPGRLAPYPKRANPDNEPRTQTAAKQLESRIREMLKAAQQDDGYYSDNGSIDASKAWRPNKTGDGRVFFKPEYAEEGGYVIDLLLDASGSQYYRMEDIARQAWIIAEAVTRAGIPIRVTSFRSAGLLTVIELHRDYEDPVTENVNCLKFRADHWNRDGLAIAAIAKSLKERPEDKKIMIVLSDGAPANSDGSGIINEYGGMDEYEGSIRMKWNGKEMSAVDDVAQTVRQIRKDGIALMGIYVGDEGHLQDEKAMYGNDFAYIRQMDDFVPVITRYLEKQIKGLESS